MDLQTILILSAVINVIILICFFVLCSNVVSIKNRLRGNEALPATAFAMYLAMGEKEKAKRILIDKIFNDNDIQAAIVIDVVTLRNAMAKYIKMLKEVDIEFDAEKAYYSRALF